MLTKNFSFLSSTLCLQAHMQRVVWGCQPSHYSQSHPPLYSELWCHSQGVVLFVLMNYDFVELKIEFPWLM